MKTLNLVLIKNIYDGVYVQFDVVKRGDAIPNVALELHYYCRERAQLVLLIFL